jgi:beta-lactamase regulating signal transducer with metallopeptidase domain
MIDAAAWTLLHFLWEGTLIVLLVFVPLRLLRQASARYVVACAAMLLMLVLPLATFAFMMLTGDVRTPGDMSGFTFSSSPLVRFAGQATSPQNAWTPFVVTVWAIGVVLFSLRNAGGLFLAYLWGRRAVIVAPSECYEAVMRIAASLGLRRTVRLRVSSDGMAPLVLGWIKPVVVVPAAALKLPFQQMEALLAHELAHIRRHDFLVNLCQKCVEILLFYHPAVWWLGRRIREERENCCDDLAVGICGDRVIYAQALTNLEELRISVPQFAMAADGGSLVRRIARLLGKTYPASGSSVWLVAVIAACGLATLAGVVLRAQERNTPSPAAVLAANPELKVQPRAPEQPQPPQPQPPQAPQQPQQSQPPVPDKPANSGTSSYIDQLAAAGYKDLSVDELISFKIHGVSAEYIRSLQAAGFNPGPSDLLSCRIHGVTADYARALQAIGFPVTLDQLISGRIHGVDPEAVSQLKAAGFSSLTFDQALTARIHGVTPDEVRELQNSGLGNLSFDDIITARIHGITPVFVRKAQQTGLKNLTFDKIVQLKIHRVLD